MPKCETCGKFTYPTVNEAYRAIRRHRNARSRVPYRCPEGEGWHLRSDLSHGRVTKRKR